MNSIGLQERYAMDPITCADSFIRVNDVNSVLCMKVFECVNHFRVGNIRQVGANNSMEQRDFWIKLWSDISYISLRDHWRTGSLGKQWKWYCLRHLKWDRRRYTVMINPVLVFRSNLVSCEY